jgi:hypothetical protein
VSDLPSSSTALRDDICIRGLVRILAPFPLVTTERSC